MNHSDSCILIDTTTSMVTNTTNFVD